MDLPVLIAFFSYHILYLQTSTRRSNIDFDVDDDFDEDSGSDFDDDEDPDKIEVPGMLKYF